MYIILCLIFVSVSSGDLEPNENKSRNLDPLATSNTMLTFKLLKELNNMNTASTCFSPISILMAFSSLTAGTKADSTTQKELMGALQLNRSGLLEMNQVNEQFFNFNREINNVNHDNCTLKMANKILVQKKFDIKGEYKKNVRENYNSSIDEVDFASEEENILDTINDWVNNETNRTISKLFDKPLDELSRMVMLNVVYFKGIWKHKFEKESEEKDFYSYGTESKSKKLMFMQNEAPRKHYANNMYTIVKIEYSCKLLEFYIVLPKELDGLKKILKYFETPENYFKFTNQTENMNETRVKLSLPRFKLESNLDLKKVMKNLGLSETIFENEEFTEIADTNIRLSKAFQKVSVVVNEEGTKATAATVTGITSRMVQSIKSVNVNVNRPFLFMIKQSNTKIIWFIGCVFDIPQQN
ncbi:serpin B13-like isoform X3 [Leptotrombidium deliense]|uniref:Serpin B13-like isoform X3 n=1 Tax=Leptotrombidium deliense TaxID=299467 RepID=A0A443SJ61_9ACAR|nr:serpin B13-like isoform X3 [Leptotrombidium deliense]